MKKMYIVVMYLSLMCYRACGGPEDLEAVGQWDGP